jgi:hypothetical protein
VKEQDLQKLMDRMEELNRTDINNQNIIYTQKLPEGVSEELMSSLGGPIFKSVIDTNNKRLFIVLLEYIDSQKETKLI